MSQSLNPPKSVRIEEPSESDPEPAVPTPPPTPAFHKAKSFYTKSSEPKPSSSQAKSPKSNSKLTPPIQPSSAKPSKPTIQVEESGDDSDEETDEESGSVKNYTARNLNRRMATVEKILQLERKLVNIFIDF